MMRTIIRRALATIILLLAAYTIGAIDHHDPAAPALALISALSTLTLLRAVIVAQRRRQAGI